MTKKLLGASPSGTTDAVRKTDLDAAITALKDATRAFAFFLS
jgi:hypothetical protein